MNGLRKIVVAYQKIGEGIEQLAEALAAADDTTDLKQDGIDFITAMGVAQYTLNKDYSIFEGRVREVEDQILI